MNCQDHLYRNDTSQTDCSTLVFGAMRRRSGRHGSRPVAGRLGRSPLQQPPHPRIRWRPKQPHYPAKAKSVIFLFMAGAPSHLELFDYKPQLAKFDGTLAPAGLAQRLSGGFHQSEFEVAGSEVQVREVRPERSGDLRTVAAPREGRRRHCHRQVDGDRRFQSCARPDFDEHRIAAVRPAQHGRLGHLRPGQRIARTCRPSSCSAQAAKGRAAAIPAGAAASCRRSIRVCSSAAAAIRFSISPIRPEWIRSCSAIRSIHIRHLNQMRLDTTGDPEIATRINSFEMAFRMQSSAPELMDVAKEPKHILELYGAEPGKPSFANNCLLARRLVERGVRFVQLFHEAWDQHGNLVKDIYQELPRHRPGLRRAHPGSQAARHAERHAGRLGRRIRPHPDGPGRQ